MATTVNTKGQVTIPEALWKKYGFLPGTEVEWIDTGGAVIPVPIKSWKELRGSLRSAPGEVTLTEVLLRERAADREREDR